MALLATVAGMTAEATAGPDLWAAYTSALAQAQRSQDRWREAVLAGGASAMAGVYYVKAWEDREAAGAAYQAWLAQKG